MKKIIFLCVLCAPLVLTQCKGTATPTNDFEIKVTVASNPVKAYLGYILDGEEIIDSVDVIDNQFVFTGVAEHPFWADLSLSYDPETFFTWKMKDLRSLFVEPGTIVMISPDSIKNATITGSVINADVDRWNAEFRIINDAMVANYYWFNGLPKKEFDENLGRYREISDSLIKVRRKLASDFVENNPDSWYALYGVSGFLANHNNLDERQAVLDKFSQRIKDSKLGKEKQTQIDALRATAIGSVAPDFTQNDTEGNPVKLSDFGGQWVLLEFWASWCGPCRVDNPHIVEAYNRFKNKGFTVLGVSLDNTKYREAWLKAIEDDKLTWTNVSDLKGWANEVAKMYAITGVPTNFLIDPQGVIVAKNLRGKALAIELEKNIK
jgi:peroxiredoxin